MRSPPSAWPPPLNIQPKLHVSISIDSLKREPLPSPSLPVSINKTLLKQSSLDATPTKGEKSQKAQSSVAASKTVADDSDDDAKEQNVKQALPLALSSEFPPETPGSPSKYTKVLMLTPTRTTSSQEYQDKVSSVPQAIASSQKTVLNFSSSCASTSLGHETPIKSFLGNNSSKTAGSASHGKSPYKRKRTDKQTVKSQNSLLKYFTPCKKEETITSSVSHKDTAIASDPVSQIKRVLFSAEKSAAVKTEPSSIDDSMETSDHQANLSNSDIRTADTEPILTDSNSKSSTGAPEPIERDTATSCLGLLDGMERMTITERAELSRKCQKMIKAEEVGLGLQKTIRNTNP